MMLILLLCLANFLVTAHEVGTFTLHLVDTTRTHFADMMQQPRDLLVQLWYPATPTIASTKAPYIGKASYIIKRNISAGAGKAVSDFDYLDTLQSDSWLNAPIAQRDMYPLIIFSPGWGTPPAIYISYFQTLARHNYIVAAISHTYNCNPTVFPDGRIIEQCNAFANLAQLSEQKIALVFDQELTVWVADIRFVIDQLLRLNTMHGYLLYESIDEQNIGIFGHSFGAAAAMRTSQLDHRIRACANMDGRLWQPYLEQPVTIPLLILISDVALNPFAKQTLADAVELAKYTTNDTYRFMIEHGHHYSFSDDAILTKDGKQECELITFIPNLIAAFFDTYLHHQDNKVLGIIAGSYHIKHYFIDIGKYLY